MDSTHPSNCNCISVSSSVNQTLDELEFQRGIWSAALDGELERVQGFLDKGIDTNSRDSSGYTALHYSARSGHLGVCRLLLERGACANAQTKGGATPLHRATLQGHLSVVELLLKWKALPGLLDSDGRNALHKAAEGGHLKIARKLLSQDETLKLGKDSRCQVPFELVKIYSTNDELLSMLTIK